jgi:hypothetical protein
MEYDDLILLTCITSPAILRRTFMNNVKCRTNFNSFSVKFIFELFYLPAFCHFFKRISASVVCYCLFIFGKTLVFVSIMVTICSSSEAMYLKELGFHFPDGLCVGRHSGAVHRQSAEPEHLSFYSACFIWSILGRMGYIVVISE